MLTALSSIWKKRDFEFPSHHRSQYSDNDDNRAQLSIIYGLFLTGSTTLKHFQHLCASFTHQFWLFSPSFSLLLVIHLCIWVCFFHHLRCYCCCCYDCCISLRCFDATCLLVGIVCMSQLNSVYRRCFFFFSLLLLLWANKHPFYQKAVKNG